MNKHPSNNNDTVTSRGRCDRHGEKGGRRKREGRKGQWYECSRKKTASVLGEGKVTTLASTSLHHLSRSSNDDLEATDALMILLV
eukprot:14308605-Ditylum_brightwellii.AAC.1